MECDSGVKVFHSPDDSASLRISVSKNGVRLDFIDYEFDLYQSWTLKSDQVVNFETGSLCEAQIQDLIKQEF